MTCIDQPDHFRRPLIAGKAVDSINSFFNMLSRPGCAAYVDAIDQYSTSYRDPREQNLKFIQDYISNLSMHLPEGCSKDLNRKFANLLDEDAWEDDDELLSGTSLAAFTTIIIQTEAKRCPSIGTNGLGSITASWVRDGNRLIVDCLPNGKVSLVLSRVRGEDDIERAAFAAMKPRRVPDVLAPFNPGIWFDV